jgi:hypothetical protein
MTRPSRRLLTVRLAGPSSPLSVEWSADGTIVYAALGGGRPARTVEVAPDVLADYDAAGALVGFEVLGADRPRPLLLPSRDPSRARRPPTERWSLVVVVT